MISKKNYEAPEMEIAKVESVNCIMEVGSLPGFNEEEAKSRDNEIETEEIW